VQLTVVAVMLVMVVMMVVMLVVLDGATLFHVGIGVRMLMIAMVMMPEWWESLFKRAQACDNLTNIKSAPRRAVPEHTGGGHQPQHHPRVRPQVAPRSPGWLAAGQESPSSWSSRGHK
jgi:hypothetical protein